MNNYNPNLHHRHSIRLKGYDYSQEGLYFITICVNGRKCLFGKIVIVDDVGVENIQSRQEMKLNDAGKIANQCWMEIPKHFPNTVLHEYVVMPNHVHGIIELINPGSPTIVGVQNVGVQNFEPLQQSPNKSLSSIWVENFQPKRNEFQKMIPHSIGSIVKGFKIGVTKWFRNNTDIKKVWQRNYYEHIIRNEISFHKISDYIINNPSNWNKDVFFDE